MHRIGTSIYRQTPSIHHDNKSYFLLYLIHYPMQEEFISAGPADCHAAKRCISSARLKPGDQVEGSMWLLGCEYSPRVCVWFESVLLKRTQSVSVSGAALGDIQQYRPCAFSEGAYCYNQKCSAEGAKDRWEAELAGVWTSLWIPFLYFISKWNSVVILILTMADDFQ